MGCDNLKVLHIIDNLGSGGAEKLIEESLPLMKNAMGIEVELLLLSDKEDVISESLKKSGVKVDVIPLRKSRSPLNIFYIRRYIVKGQYNIIHTHLFPTIYWVSIASIFIFKNKPSFFYTEHSTHNRRRDKSYLRPLEKFIYSSFDRIISISDSTQENLIKWLKPKQRNMNKFIVINNGVNINKIREAKPYEKVGIDSDLTGAIKLLCMIGRFSKAKDQSTIIRAMKNIPKDVHLLLVGVGPLKIYNEKFAEDIGVSNRVHFLGFRNDVERILKTSYIIIQSSNWEGFGLSAVEGMAAGRPIIASNIEGLREVIKGAGILFEKGNSEELANEVINIIQDNKKYKDIAEACLTRAKSFDVEIMVREILIEYQKARKAKEFV
jgi:glycosyltransferase involved in cell wall biosynthesis